LQLLVMCLPVLIHDIMKMIVIFTLNMLRCFFVTSIRLARTLVSSEAAGWCAVYCPSYWLCVR